MEDRDIRRPAADDATYSTAARRFHWWTVAFLAVQIPVGLFMVRYAATTELCRADRQALRRPQAARPHDPAARRRRLIYRLAHGAPADEPTLEPWEKVVSHVTHWAIYALLIVVPVLGWLAVSLLRPLRAVRHQAAGAWPHRTTRGDAVFFLHMVGRLRPDRAAGMHVGAALIHYLIRKDGVLRRMWVRAGRLS